MSKCKLVTITGASCGVGTTTIANYMAVEIAKRGYITLLIEFKTRTGFSIYMQKGLHETRRSLSEVMALPEKLNDNTIKSCHTAKLRYLCMNFRDDSLKMRNYSTTNIVPLITEAKKYFEYIILDLPADNLEPITPMVLSSEFIHKPDHQLVVVDEQASTFKYLNDLNVMMLAAKESGQRDTTFILNRVEAAHYQDYIVEYLPSLPVTKPVNLVYIPSIEGLSVICNKGDIYAMGVNKKTKLFCSQLDILADIVEKDLKNIKADKVDTLVDGKVKKLSLLEMIFGKKKQTQKDDIRTEDSSTGIEEEDNSISPTEREDELPEEYIIEPDEDFSPSTDISDEEDDFVEENTPTAKSPATDDESTDEEDDLIIEDDDEMIFEEDEVTIS